MTTPTTFREVAAQLAANGYRPVPIRKGGKHPGLKDWQRFTFTESDATKYPGAGAGVLLGDVVGVDIDVDDEDAARACEDAVREALHLGDAAILPRRIGRYPRVLLPLRCASAFTKMMSAQYTLRASGTAAKVEILAMGQQFVAYHVHPDTGRPYEWNGGGDLLAVRRDDLPEVDEATARAIIAACEAALEEYGERVAAPEPLPACAPVASAGAVREGGRNAELTRLAGKLRRDGLSPDAMAAALVQHNAEHCAPPLPEREVRAIAASVGRYQPAEKDREEPALPAPETALALLERDMDPIGYLCDPYIPEGLTIVAGRPKCGKTTLERQKLAAVAGGGEIFGAECTKATAMFLCLEEGDRLTRAKFEMAGFARNALASILIHFAWRRGTEGILDLQRTLDANAGVRYVVVDSLTRFRAVPDTRTPAFVADYEAVSALHAIAKARPGLCISVIHHTRKAKSDDPLDDISGTYGVSAACDSYWVMRHHEDGAVLHVGGRLWAGDVSQFQLRRDNQRWVMDGEFTGLTPAQSETLALIRDGKGLTPSQVAASLGLTHRQSAYDRLDALVRNGRVYSKLGRYYAK